MSVKAEAKEWMAFAEELLAPGYAVFEAADIKETELGASDPKVFAIA